MAAAENTPTRWAIISRVTEANNHLIAFCQLIGFPVEVRYFTCGFFESQDWDTKDEKKCRVLKDVFCKTLEQVMDQLIGPFESIRQLIMQAYNRFKAMDPVEFVQLMKQCADKEKELVSLIRMNPDGNFTLSDKAISALSSPEAVRRAERAKKDKSFRQQLEIIKQKTMESEKKLKDLQHHQENFVIQYQEFENFKDEVSKLDRYIQAMRIAGITDGERNRVIQEHSARLSEYPRELKARELKLAEQGNTLLTKRMEMQQMFAVIISELERIQSDILDDELMGWKRRQQLSYNGGQLDKEELSFIQDWCELLATLVWAVRTQVKIMTVMVNQVRVEYPEGTHDMIPSIEGDITTMLSSLVTSTFIVETQPPQVLKKESRFSTGVRILVGGALNLHMNAPQVTATIISELQAKRLLVHKDMDVKRESSGEILNNVGSMDYVQDSRVEHCGVLSINFRNMQLKRIKRSDKKGGETVCEEKFCILFQSSFNVGGPDLRCEVWMLSLPVVVTVHGNQECHATGTIFWDNAFCEPGRDPFVVPDTVIWPHLADQLSLKFEQATGRGLTQENLDYLASKIFNVTIGDYSHQKITWSQFNKEPLRERTFTFWEWFFAVMKLTKEYLKGPWVDGAIIGFISKVQAQEYLKETCNNTFLLRFSDSECGCISVAWIDMVDPSKPSLERDVWNLSPYGAKDFQVRTLGDRLKDLKNLLYLYPNLHKDQVFSKYYSTMETDVKLRNGYVASELRTTIPESAGQHRGNVPPYSEPGTPRSAIGPFSPQSDYNSQSPGPFRPGSLTDILEDMDGLMDGLDSEPSLTQSLINMAFNHTQEM